METNCFGEIDAGIAAGASDWQFRGGERVYARVGGRMRPLDGEPLSEERVEAVAAAVLGRRIGDAADHDASFEHAGQTFRLHAYRAGGVRCFTLRRLAASIPRLEELGLPAAFREQALAARRGLILVTGPTGAGKTTTLAATVDLLNRERAAVILTLEDPIEYRHAHRRGVVRQTELGRDFPSFAAALRGALRVDPDVILLGEMRDRETISAAIAAAETGHLVLATLHCGSAPEAVARVAGAFPAGQSGEIRAQLAENLVAVLAQQIVRGPGRRPAAAFELLLATPGVRRLIADPGQRWPLLANEIATGAGHGMIAMDQSLEELCRRRIVAADEAVRAAAHPETLRERLRASA
ncbi:MAG: type IV pilus twitching motility protein PilT [Opitutaceae bacterium]